MRYRRHRSGHHHTHPHTRVERPTRQRSTRATTRAQQAAVDRIAVANTKVPGYFQTVDGPKYRAMKEALLKVLPRRAPGLTQPELMQAVRPHLPPALFPGGDKAGRWVKCVQLDLEAKQVVRRDSTARPQRWMRAR